MSNNVLKSIDTPMLALTGTADKGTSAAIISRHHQQAGRAGRDGNRSDIVVIYHGQQYY